MFFSFYHQFFPEENSNFMKLVISTYRKYRRPAQIFLSYIFPGPMGGRLTKIQRFLQCVIFVKNSYGSKNGYFLIEKLMVNTKIALKTSKN